MSRAPTQASAINRARRFVDPRKSYQKAYDGLRDYKNTIITISFVTLLAIFMPKSIMIFWPIAWVAFLVSFFDSTDRVLPMKLPFWLNMVDKHDNKPGQRHKFNKARGTIYFGQEQLTEKECWLVGKDLLTHLLVIATTGGGKTNMLISLAAATAFVMGGGCIYVDAKAAKDLILQFYALARIFGREDDVRVVNYSTGNVTTKERHPQKNTNTANPFAVGSPNTCVQTLRGLMPENAGDNQYFLDRAVGILQALFPALTQLRDERLINLAPSIISNFISINKFIELCSPEKHNNEIVVERDDGTKFTIPNVLDLRIRAAIKLFLTNLPDFQVDENGEPLPEKDQTQDVNKQFGFSKGYFARMMVQLSATYGHIYEVEKAEVDYVDVIMNNRLLLVMIPAMEEAPDERQALGKIVLSSIRVAMSMGLGDKAEGDVGDIVDNLPIDLKVPSIIIVDEYAECAVPGFAITATQGRGLGMACVFAGQDLPGIKRASESEMLMIFANTRLKALGANEDPTDTWQMFKDLAGTINVAESQGWDEAEGLERYKDNLTAQVKEVERLNILDLKEQIEGEFHVFQSSNIIRANTFSYGIDHKAVKNIRQNRMLPIKLPPSHVIDELKLLAIASKYCDEFVDNGQILSQKPSDITKGVVPTDDIEWIKNWLSDLNSVNEDVLGNSVESEAETPQSKQASQNKIPQQQSLPITSEDSSVPDAPGNEITSPLTAQENTEGEHEEKAKQETKITDILADADNKWVYHYSTDQSSLNSPEELYKNLNTLMQTAGVDAQESADSSVAVVTSITENVPYTSKPTVEPQPDDAEKLWAALGTLNDNENSSSEE